VGSVMDGRAPRLEGSPVQDTGGLSGIEYGNHNLLERRTTQPVARPARRAGQGIAHPPAAYAVRRTGAKQGLPSSTRKIKYWRETCCLRYRRAPLVGLDATPVGRVPPPVGTRRRQSGGGSGHADLQPPTVSAGTGVVPTTAEHRREPPPPPPPPPRRATGRTHTGKRGPAAAPTEAKRAAAEPQDS